MEKKCFKKTMYFLRLILLIIENKKCYFLLAVLGLLKCDFS